MTPEHALQNSVRLAIGKNKDIVSWRNNVGDGFIGKYIRLGQDVLIQNARPISFGLCNGSSDLIGIRRITVTPDMVGTTIGVFVALEMKQLGEYPSKEQRNFIRTIKDFGGTARVIRTVADLEGI